MSSLQQRNRIPRLLILGIGLLLILGAIPVFAQSSAGVIAPTRAVDWTKAGVPGFSATGTLPSDSWTQCGATINAGASAATIAGALSHTGSGYTSCAANTYIQLAAGTFNLSSGITDTGVSNTELRGSGASQTHLVFTGTSTCTGGSSQCWVGFASSDGSYGGSPSAATNWTAGYSMGATSVTVASGTNITANSSILVFDQCDTGYSGATCTGTSTDNGGYFACSQAYVPSGPTGCGVNGPDTGFARTNRFTLEMIQASSCSPSCGSSGSTTVTLSRPLHHPVWASGQTPQMWLIQPIKNVGVRDLSLGAATTSVTEGVGMFNCLGCWVKGVTVLNSQNMGVYCWDCNHVDISNNYFYNYGQGGRATGGDPTGVKYNGSDNLIANNIMQKGAPCTMEEGAGDGNALLYNFCINSDVENDASFGANEQHAEGDDYNLYEGNMAYTGISDQNHGTHMMETFYRNFYTGWESCANGQCGSFTAKDVQTFALSILGYNRYPNLIANVLGTPGYSNTYTSETNEWDVNQAVFVLGSGNGAAPGGAIPLDTVVPATTYRWGNWDAANNATRWVTSEVPTAISGFPQSVPTTTCTSSLSCPASFYYSSRPSWYSSSTPFPAIGPDVSSGNIGQCSGTLNTSGKFSGMPTPDGTICGSGNTKSTAWGGHVNAVPAMQAYLHFGGNLDGTSAALTTFDESYYASSSPISTSTSLTPSSFTPVAGTNITLTASVTPSSGPTGTVTFFDGGTSIGSSTLPTLTHTVTAITAGTHVYTATYNGDSSYSSSTSSAANVVASGPSGSVVTTGITFKGGVVVQ